MNTASAAANSNNPRPRSASEEPRAQRTWIAVLAAAIAGVLLLLITPFPRGFQGETTGDAALVSQVENALDSGHWHHVAAAKIRWR